jgi:hypothetical protein
VGGKFDLIAGFLRVAPIARGIRATGNADFNEPGWSIDQERPIALAEHVEGSDFPENDDLALVPNKERRGHVISHGAAALTQAPIEFRPTLFLQGLCCMMNWVRRDSFLISGPT